jgi:hypothetical protein
MYYLAVYSEASDGGIGGKITVPGETHHISPEIFACTENAWQDLVAVPDMGYIETWWKAYDEDITIDGHDLIADVITVENTHQSTTRIFMNGNKAIKAIFYPKRVTGIFVRGTEVQATFNTGQLMRSPDWGKNWWEGANMPTPSIDVSFDAAEITKSFVLGDTTLHRTIDGQLSDSDFVYMPVLATLSGSSVCTEMSLDYPICYIATDKALYKTADGGNTIFTIKSVDNIIDFAIGGVEYGNEVVLYITASGNTNVYVNTLPVSIPYSGGFSLGTTVTISGAATGGKTWWKWESDVELLDQYNALQHIDLWSNVNLEAYVTT